MKNYAPSDRNGLTLRKIKRHLVILSELTILQKLDMLDTDQ